jgi:fermentation-respiration switch protein FrsA (DUF1100 family)
MLVAMARLLALILFVVVLVLLLFWLMQRQMIYLPSGDVGSPAQAGLASAAAVTFATEDGLTLNGWFVPARAPARGDSLIVFNGNAGNRSYRADIASNLTAAGIDVLLFDYRGYGENPGSPSEEGLAMDARAARRYLESRAGVDPRRISYFGESLGGGVAVRLALEHPPRALVLRSPFTSLIDTGQHHFPYLPVRWLLRDKYASVDVIANVKAPLLVITAAHDSVVPAIQSRSLFDAAREPKRLVTVEGADHNDLELVSGPKVTGAIVQFLDGLGR